jgi:hypothetical protein
MKNNDLPYIKQLLADDYHEGLHQSYELFEYLAEEQNFTFEFIQLPPINEGSFLQSIISISLLLFFLKDRFNYYSKFVLIPFLSFMVMVKHWM